jgi:hypothetical protein
MNQYYTYMYFDPRSGDPFYVGKGKDSRMDVCRKSNKQVLGRAMKLQELGLKPIIEVINTTNELSAFWLERCLIAAYGRKDNGTGILFNHTDGGEGSSGRHVTYKMSEQGKLNHKLVWTPEKRESRSLLAKSLNQKPPVGTPESAKRARLLLKGHKKPVGFMLGKTHAKGKKQSPEHIAKRVASRKLTLEEKNVLL